MLVIFAVLMLLFCQVAVGGGDADGFAVVDVVIVAVFYVDIVVDGIQCWPSALTILA